MKPNTVKIAKNGLDVILKLIAEIDFHLLGKSFVLTLFANSRLLLICFHTFFYIVANQCGGKEFRCKNGACVDEANVCLHRIDRFGYPIGCRDATHLEGCGT